MIATRIPTGRPAGMRSLGRGLVGGAFGDLVECADDADATLHMAGNTSGKQSAQAARGGVGQS